MWEGYILIVLKAILQHKPMTALIVKNMQGSLQCRSKLLSRNRGHSPDMRGVPVMTRGKHRYMFELADTTSFLTIGEKFGARTAV